MLKRLTVVSLILGLMAMSGIALAAEGDEDDTIFNWAYDVVWRVLIWNMTPTDGLYDCTLTGGPFTTTYSLSEAGVDVDDLTDTSGVVTFPARPQDELAEGLEEAEGPVDYSGANGECGLSGGSVAGPNGQVNHGMFMKLFNSLYDGPGGRGCVVRHLAQSDLGKGDQQVRVPDVDPDAPELVDGDTGSVEFDSVVTACGQGNGHGNADKVTGQDKAAEKRAEAAEKRAEAAEKRAEKAANRADQAKADKVRGKSDSAPGRGR